MKGISSSKFVDISNTKMLVPPFLKTYKAGNNQPYLLDKNVRGRLKEL